MSKRHIKTTGYRPGVAQCSLLSQTFAHRFLFYCRSLNVVQLNISFSFQPIFWPIIIQPNINVHLTYSNSTNHTCFRICTSVCNENYLCFFVSLFFLSVSLSFFFLCFLILSCFLSLSISFFHSLLLSYV